MIDEELHPEQAYIGKTARSLGIEYALQEHEKATITCQEKADLIGFPLEHVVKAIYVADPKAKYALAEGIDYEPSIGQGGHMVGIIVPDGLSWDVRSVLRASLERMTGNVAKRYSNGIAPSGMMKGTCTPFPLESSIGSEIDRLIFCSTGENPIVDISVGGTDESWLRKSMHIPYEGIYAILSKKFGDRIVRYQWSNAPKTNI